MSGQLHLPPQTNLTTPTQKEPLSLPSPNLNTKMSFQNPPPDLEEGEIPQHPHLSPIATSSDDDLPHVASLPFIQRQRERQRQPFTPLRYPHNTTLSRHPHATTYLPRPKSPEKRGTRYPETQPRSESSASRGKIGEERAAAKRARMRAKEKRRRDRRRAEMRASLLESLSVPVPTPAPASASAVPTPTVPEVTSTTIKTVARTQFKGVDAETVTVTTTTTTGINTVTSMTSVTTVNTETGVLVLAPEAHMIVSCMPALLSVGEVGVGMESPTVGGYW